MNPRTNHQGDSRGHTTAAPDDEELETGDPIHDEDEPQTAKKIPGRRGKFSGGGQPEQVEPPAPGEGRMVLSSARYLQKNTDPEVERQNRKIRQKEKEQRTGDGGPLALEKSVFNGGVLGGSLAMVGAVVWFVVGLENDVIFFYPPILFVVGLGALLKGLMGGSTEETS